MKLQWAIITFFAVWGTETPALATDAKVPIACAKTTTISVGSSEQSVCLEGDETAWIDVIFGAQVLAIQLTGERHVVEIGAAPSLGFVLAWKPVWWTATKTLVGLELLLSASLIDSTGFDHVRIWTVGGLNLLGYLSVGLGGIYGIAVREGLPDTADLVLTSGLRVPL